MDDIKIEFPFYIVAWIDFLGQGKNLENIPTFPQNQEEMNKFIRPFAIVNNFRNNILSYLEPLNRFYLFI